MLLTDMTSPARVQLAAAVITHVSRSVTIGKDGPPSLPAQRLAARLDARPFEAMTLDELADLAIEFGVAEQRVADIVVKASNEYSRVEARYLCGTCLDQQVIRVNTDDGSERFGRCPTCNGGPVPFDPKESL